MDRRTAAAIVVLALAALVVIAAWLLRADGATPTVAPPTIPPSPAALVPPAPLSAPATAVAASTASTPSTLSTSVDQSLTTDDDRPLTADELRALLEWAPKGRVVEAGTGTPLPWWTVWIETRRSDRPIEVATRILERGTETGKDAEALAAFDLTGAGLSSMSGITHGGTIKTDSPPVLEYRIGARADRHRSTSTPWRPFPEGAPPSDLTIEMQPDALSTLLAHVRNPDGSSFRGHVSANFREEHREYHGGISADTDADGRARLQEVPSGEFRVRLLIHVREPGAWAPSPILTDYQEVNLPEGGSTEAEFSLPVRGEIAIKWTDAYGAELKGRYTHLERVAGYSAHVDRLVGLRPGPATLALQVEGYRDWKSTVEVVAGQVTRVEARFEKREDSK